MTTTVELSRPSFYKLSAPYTVDTAAKPSLRYQSSYGWFTCTVDPNTLRPYRDCINIIAAYCSPSSPIYTSWSDCQFKTSSIKNVLNANWKAWIQTCAKFLGGNPTSNTCKTNALRILGDEYYYWKDDDAIQFANVPPSVVQAAESIWII